MLQSGQLLDGRYKILEKLGEGNFGETYTASDERRPSKPICVVKRLKTIHASQFIRGFFEKEAIVLEKLGEHPQIPRLLAHFMSSQELFIVQDFIGGNSLRQEITLGKRWNEDYVIKLLQDVLETLVFVHENGVIHRDIKPDNVMRRSKDGRLVLIDFGIVKQLGSLVVATDGEVKTTSVAGTPGYTPSEQAKGKPCPSSDLYALGMTAIEALTGIPPYHLPEDPETGEVIWRDRVQISDRLAAFLEKMVRDRYTQRYASAIEALQALQQTVGGGATTFTFEVVTVNERGQEISHRPGQAEYFVEDLGNGITLEMVKIPGGRFLMGSPDNEPERYDDEGSQHQVTVPAFFMGKFAVTQAQYQAIVGNNPSGIKGENRPVKDVSWHDAVVFCDRLSQRTERTYRLPSEAEWEYACRAGTITPFHFGETITTDLANYNGAESVLLSEPTYRLEPKGKYRQRTIEVGSFPPNAFGLYDMHGNVWEWCADHWHEKYQGAPIDGSAWVDGGDGNRRPLRGGSWDTLPRHCRSDCRSFISPVNRNDPFGFRVVCSLEQTL